MVVHGHVVIPGVVISQCVHELCIKECVVIILCAHASRFIRDVCTLRFQSYYNCLVLG